MNSCELVSFVTAISCAIANCVPRDDLPLITAILGQIATTLTTITENEDIIHPKETPGTGAPGGMAPGRMLPGGATPDDNLEIPPVTDILSAPPIF